MPARIRRPRKRASRNGSKRAACCCASPGCAWPSRATISCRSVCGAAAAPSAAPCRGTARQNSHRLPPLETLDGFGRLQHAPPTARPIAASEIATAKPSPRHPPGFYGTADARRALNLSTGITELKPIGELPGGVVRESFAKSAEVDFRPPLLTAAFLFALFDLLIAYALRGLLRLRPARIAAAILFALIALPSGAAPAAAEFV